MPDQSQINEDVDIIEGEADILEAKPTGSKAKSKMRAHAKSKTSSVKQTPQPKAASGYGRIIGLIMLFMLIIGLCSFALFEIITTKARLASLEEEMQRLTMAQAAQQASDIEQRQSDLSERQADQQRLEEMQTQLATLIDTQSKQASQNNSQQTDAEQDAIIIALMMWQIASDDRLLSLSDMVSSLPDSQIKADLTEILMIANDHQIGHLMAQGQALWQQQAPDTKPVLGDDTGVLSAVRQWFAEAVNLQALSDKQGVVAQADNEFQTIKGLATDLPASDLPASDLSALFDALEQAPSAATWRAQVTLRLSLPSKIEQIIRQSFQNELSQP